MMKLTDFLAHELKRNNVEKVYGLTGGAVVHIFDSAHRNGIDVTFANHEQAAAFAAVGHSKLTNGPSGCIVTTGPGVTNAITGLTGAWLDSVPVIFISGQSRMNQTSNNHENIRQIGTQQLNVLPIVDSLTKYCVMLEDPKDIRYELEKCFHLATSGRKGPVWIDIPLDIQGQIMPSPNKDSKLNLRFIEPSTISNYSYPKKKLKSVFKKINSSFKL